MAFGRTTYSVVFDLTDELLRISVSHEMPVSHDQESAGMGKDFVDIVSDNHQCVPGGVQKCQRFKYTSNTGQVETGKGLYLEALQLIERLHRQFLDVVKAELDREDIKDCNNVQALILYNIGEDEMTVGELTTRGYYLGSNVTYNLKKLVENGFVDQERSAHDRRSVRIKLSDKGLVLHKFMEKLYHKHVVALNEGVIENEALDGINQSLRTLERFWADQLRFGGR